ncbi:MULTISPECIES: cytochrome bd oxidase small subunit CydS [Paenibacillus]
MENFLIQYAAPVIVLFSLVFLLFWVTRSSDVIE